MPDCFMPCGVNQSFQYVEERCAAKPLEVRGERREYYRFVAIDRKQDKQHTPEREKEKQLFLFWKKV